MTTRDFIKNTYNVASDKPRQCSSVFTDYDGTVYSYGYHYPLAFNVEGLDFICTSGYSNTTAKHIAWAWSAVPHAIGVKLWTDEAKVIASRHSTPDEKLKAIKVALKRELDSIQKEMSTKKRHDTWVYKDLQNREVRVIQGLEAINR